MILRTPLKALLLGGAILGLTVACQSSSDSGAQKATPVAKKAKAPKKAKPMPKEELPPPLKELAANHNGWKTVQASNLSGVQAVQRKRAMESQKTVGGALIKTLSTAIAEGGHAKAIPLCQVEAMSIPASEAKAKGLKIGRSSQKLRNPSNAPPLWAEDAIALGVKSPVFRVSPEGTLGMLNPVLAQEMCMGCHGAADQLAEGVSEELAKRYPEDKATGYKPGDLRGYFWIEVPEG